MSAGPFFVAAHLDVPASALALARTSPRAALADAVADMGAGVVFDATGAVVAFHERHLRLIEHRGAARMAAAVG